MKSCPRTLPPFLGLLLCLLLAWPVQAAAPKWDPIPPEDLAAKECSWQPDAKAEHLFINQVLHDIYRDYHQRTKIYKYDSVLVRGILSIQYWEGEKIRDLFMRVVKPDGRTIEYTRKDFKESLALRTSEVGIKQLSAGFGELGDGDIVEIKWTRSTGLDGWERFEEFCQGTVPTRLYTLRFLTSRRNCLAQMYNVEHSELSKPNANEILMVARNMPAFQEEPMSRSPRDLRGWVGLFFRSNHYAAYTGDQLWTAVSKYWHETFLEETKAGAPLAAKARDLVAGCSDENEKLRRLYEYCRKEIRNFDTNLDAGLTAQKKKRDKPDPWNCMDTFNAKSGYSRDITLLFGAMARAVGFDIRFCMAANRLVSTEISHPAGYFFLNDLYIGIRKGETWQLYSPGHTFVPPGMIHKSNEQSPYLRCFPDTLDLITTRASAASRSPLTRNGRFSLDAEGTLEGTVELDFAGHEAIELRTEYAKSNEQDLDKRFKETFCAPIPGAEISELAWANLKSLEETVTVKFRLRIPGYAELIGDRLSVAPGVFCRYGNPLFSAPTRKHDIVFDHARMELDDVEIILPEGYQLEAASAPDPVVTQFPVLSADYKVAYKKATRKLSYQRSFTQCRDGALNYKASSYEFLKRLSEFIHKSDTHTILCKPTAATATKETPPEAPSPQPAPSKP